MLENKNRILQRWLGKKRPSFATKALYPLNIIKMQTPFIAYVVVDNVDCRVGIGFGVCCATVFCFREQMTLRPTPPDVDVQKKQFAVRSGVVRVQSTGTGI